MTAKILLVEDNPSDEKLTLRAFKRSGLANAVDVVRDGQEALDYIFRQGPYAERDNKQPALMLLDLNIPKIDGLEVLRRVRAEPSLYALPVVVLTSSQEQEDLARSYALGCNAYVRKPVDFQEFIEAARTLGMFWMLLNERPSGPKVSGS